MTKIIVVEDEDILADLLIKKLEEEGYDVSRAKDGEEGLTKIEQEKPDLVLLDIVMPKKGGFEVLEAIRKSPDIKDLPVIIISNSGQPVEISKALELGVKDYLVKTQFDPEEVVDKVRRQLR